MSEWIEWTGGECPVDRGAAVDLRYSGGVEAHHLIAGRMDWIHYKGVMAKYGGNIVAYRVAEPRP